MKTLQIFLLSLSFLFVSLLASAQTKTENIRVAGECGTCKKKIETAAKKAGASYALWNPDTKVLTVKYNSSSSNTARIEKAVAAAGYDTQDVKADETAYNNLDDCCKYDRDTLKPASCCDDAKCAQSACMKDGKCTPGSACCQQAACKDKECCKKN